MLAMRSGGIVFAATLLTAPLAVADDIYRWIDSRGVTIYGNQPPPQARGLTLLTRDGEPKTVLRPPPVVERAYDAVTPPGPSQSAVDRATVEQLARALGSRERQ